MNHKTVCGINVFLIITLLISMLFTGCSKNNVDISTEQYWVSAHYFADGWPKNMWDSEFENIDEDFKKIRSDGFNSVVLLIPWREFQPDINNPRKFNEVAFTRLNELMKCAEENDLGIILRLGYFWDYYNNNSAEEISNRFYNLVSQVETMNAWLEYSAQVYDTASDFDNFLGGFICWEDFWGVVESVKSISGNNDLSRRYAKELGYSEYLLENYSLDELIQQYNISFTNLYDIYIPAVTSAGFQTFYAFYDAYLNGILKKTQEVFPGLSMEVRVDDDLVVNESGESQYYSHVATYPCDGANYTTIVYGVPMGFENKGERVSWNVALDMTKNILNKVASGAEYKKLFIDQFLFYDNTAKFSYNAQIEESQVGEYLLAMPDVLLDYSMGYGIWTYKDYYFDLIANGEFAKGLSGWNSSSNASVESVDGSNMCLLSKNGFISQEVLSKLNETEGEITCSFDAKNIKSEAIITVHLGENEKKVLIKEGGKYQVTFKADAWGDIRISTDEAVYIDNIRLYNFCQNGLLYDVEWNEQEYIKAVREMNKVLAKTIAEQETKDPFYDFIENFPIAKVEGQVDTEDYPWGMNICIINDDKRQIFITPNTSFEQNLTMDGNERHLYAKYVLHETAVEWNISDGSNIRISICGEDGTVLAKTERVESKGMVGTFKINLENFRDQNITVRMTCEEEDGYHENADWVVIEELYIE